MPVYMLIEITVQDQKLYADYIEKVYGVVSAHGGKYLVRGGKVEPVSQNWNPERIIIIEFDNWNQMKSCFESTEYLEIASLREQSTISRAIAVEGWSDFNHTQKGYKQTS